MTSRDLAIRRSQEEHTLLGTGFSCLKLMVDGTLLASATGKRLQFGNYFDSDYESWQNLGDAGLHLQQCRGNHMEYGYPLQHHPE